MAYNFLYKPYAQGSVGTGKAAVVLPKAFKDVSLVNKEGKVIDTFSGTGALGEGGYKYTGSLPGSQYGENVYLRLGGDNDQYTYFSLPKGGMKYTGQIDTFDPNDIENAVTLAESTPTYVPGAGAQYSPGQAGTYGFYPANLEDKFPTASKIKYRPIKTAPYEFTDPMQFAEEFGALNRSELQKNYEQAKELSLEQLDAELQGLQSYVPAASALKRQETALDNIFNQQQRMAQVREALPGVEGQLTSQARRAEAYAAGRLPDEMQDRALELGIRSRAADRAQISGFGGMAATKASDLMSAEERFKIGQYGEQLLTGNIGTKAGLFLAPTEYSDAGTQVKVMPEVSASRLMAQNVAEMNQYTLMRPEAALQSQVQQNQFKTNLEDQTRRFNKTNQYDAQVRNVNAKNQFAIDKFNYQVSWAGAVAGAAQTNANTELQLKLAEIYREIYGESKEDTQKGNTISSIIKGVGDIASTVIGGIMAFSNKTTPGAATQGTETTETSEKSTATEEKDSAINSYTGATYGNNGIATNQDGTTKYTTPEAAEADGMVPISSNDDGTVNAYLPYETKELSSSQMSNFSNAMGFSAPVSVSPQTAANLTKGAAAVMGQAGITNVAYANSVPAGVDYSGRPIYSNAALAKNQDTSVGNGIVKGLRTVIDPLGVLSAEDATMMDKVGTIASDTAFISDLTAMQAEGDSKGFVNRILAQYQKPLVDTIAGTGKENFTTNQGFSAAFDAYQVFQSWDHMSGAQKSLALASIGIKGFNSATGENLWTKKIPGTGLPNTPELNVGQAFGLLQQGVNVYGLVKNWGQLSDFQKITHGTITASALANTAKQMGFLGKGVQGAAVSVNAGEIASAGYSVAPSFGVGAITAPAGTAIPAGYSFVASSGDGIVAVPSSLISSSQPFVEANAAASLSGGSAVGGGGAGGAGAAVTQTGTTTTEVLGYAAGAASVAAGAYTVYQGWGTGGTKGAINGALGGSAMAAGLYTLGATNPYLLAGIAAVSIIGDTIKTGKPESQNARDDVRSVLKNNGLLNDKYEVRLADGTLYDSSMRGKTHKATREDPTGNIKGELKSFDIDYTNDLDYAASMGGVALTRLVTGTKSTATNQVGGEMGNAALGNIGFGKEWNETNFTKLQANLRSMYAQAGVKSKIDAFALANQAYGEGRINETDLVTMHQAFNFIFDSNGYDTASKLMNGRYAGINIAKVSSSNEKAPEVNKGSPIVTIPSALKNEAAKEAIINTRGMTPLNINPKRMPLPIMPRNRVAGAQRIRLMDLSKEDVRARNRSLYGVSA